MKNELRKIARRLPHRVVVGGMVAGGASAAMAGWVMARDGAIACAHPACLASLIYNCARMGLTSGALALGGLYVITRTCRSKPMGNTFLLCVDEIRLSCVVILAMQLSFWVSAGCGLLAPELAEPLLGGWRPLQIIRLLATAVLVPGLFGLVSVGEALLAAKRRTRAAVGLRLAMLAVLVTLSLAACMSTRAWCRKADPEEEVEERESEKEIRLSEDEWGEVRG